MNAPEKYATLDSLLLSQIGDTPVDFPALRASKQILDEAIRVTTKENAARGIIDSSPDATPGWRIVDRLQVLRMQYHIGYTPKGWVSLAPKGTP